MGTEGQAVRFRDCTCPDTPHDGRDGADDGDIVILRQHLGFAAGAEAYRKITDAIVVAKGNLSLATELMSEMVGPVYLREGPLSWNVLGENGPAPLDCASLPFTEALPIVDAADDLYTLEISSPLVKRMSGSSANGQTAKSIRPTTRSSSNHRTRSRPSSRNGSAGKPSRVSP